MKINQGAKGIGNGTSYSHQYIPYCQPGYDPVKDSSNVYSCLQCRVGFYKPYYGSEDCDPCPEGNSNP